MMVAQPIATMTEEEYLAFERASETKHEFLNGRVYAMAGATEPHIVIVGSTFFRLYGQLLGRPCRVYANDMRIKVVASGLYTYPDIAVVCGDRHFADNRRDTITNPTVLIEVLSPSTESYDRTTKWEHYQTLESLQEYLLIKQDTPRVEQYARQDDGSWRYTATLGLEAAVDLPSIGCTLRLAEIYENVAFG
jgi:Uma2 family endonuclease